MDGESLLILIIIETRAEYIKKRIYEWKSIVNLAGISRRLRQYVLDSYWNVCFRGNLDILDRFNFTKIDLRNAEVTGKHIRNIEQIAECEFVSIYINNDDILKEFEIMFGEIHVIADAPDFDAIFVDFQEINIQKLNCHKAILHGSDYDRIDVKYMNVDELHIYDNPETTINGYVEKVHFYDGSTLTINRHVREVHVHYDLDLYYYGVGYSSLEKIVIYNNVSLRAHFNIPDNVEILNQRFERLSKCRQMASGDVYG